MTPDRSSTGSFDVFLSHDSTDKPWVRTLRDQLVGLGLSVWFDERELPREANWVLALSNEGLCRSRFLALIVTPASLQRPWVQWEWTNFMANNGPGRVIPVLLQEEPLPRALANMQAIKVPGSSAAEVASLIAHRVRGPGPVPENNLRQVLGQHLPFSLRRDGEGLSVVGPDGTARLVPSPQADAGFRNALEHFRCNKLRQRLANAGPAP
jgi:hypothetical protein